MCKSESQTPCHLWIMPQCFWLSSCWTNIPSSSEPVSKCTKMVVIDILVLGVLIFHTNQLSTDTVIHKTTRLSYSETTIEKRLDIILWPLTYSSDTGSTTTGADVVVGTTGIAIIDLEL